MHQHSRISGLVRRLLLGWGLFVAVLLVGNVSFAMTAESARTVAERILKTVDFQGGLIVHVGCGDGELTAALRAKDGCLVLGLTRDMSQVERTRQYVVRAGLGGQVTIHPWIGERLPLVDNVARLIVVGESTTVPRDELLRCLRPGGVALTLDSELSTRDSFTKPWPDEVDEWTHYLRDASGNAVAKDTRVGPPRHMQWLGGPLWMRNHHMLASISALVSEGGRIYYILDEGPSANLNVPGKWTVIARDAFSGVLLWKRPIESWANWQHRFRSGPVQLGRLLVAGPDRIYLPLGLKAPLTALDAVSGEVVKTYEQTRGVEEVLLDGDALLVVTASPETAQETAGVKKQKKTPQKKNVDRRGTPQAPYVRTLMLVEAESGRLLWKWSSDDGNPEPQGLAMDGKHVCFQFGKGVICLDRQTGKELWRTPGAKKAPKSPLLMSDSTVVIEDDVVLWTDSKTVWALAAEDGRQLWSCETEPTHTASSGKMVEARAGFRSSADLFVIDGLVWIGAQFAEGRDLKTGEVRKTNASSESIYTAGHHHRCYREKATSQYILTGQRGTEFLDLAGDNHSRNNWVRGVCQYGVLPCNGLLYVPPHACGCYMEAKLSGFWSMSARRETPVEAFSGNRLVKGPAFGRVSHPAPSSLGSSWPTFRHDAMRSGNTTVTLPERLATAWKTQVADG